MPPSRWPHWRWLTALGLGLALPAAPACQGSAEPDPPGAIERPPALGASTRVLLIGNSLTAFNDLAVMVEALADSAGLSWEVDALTAGGGSLEDHWSRAATRDLIATGDWDAVVLQQGPSSLPESRAHLRQWAAVFDEAVRAAGGRASLYEVWPEGNRLDAFDRVRDSYALAAADVQGHFLAAGESWREVWRRMPDAELYGPDGFHPTPTGTYLAALAIFSGLTGRSPVGLPFRLTRPDGSAVVAVPPEAGAVLQAATAEAVATYRDYVPPDEP